MDDTRTSFISSYKLDIFQTKKSCINIFTVIRSNTKIIDRETKQALYGGVSVVYINVCFLYLIQMVSYVFFT